ncbi:MAG: DNA polymerase III subunit delta [Actinomycetes bacterium]|jgi:DNA polymerase-3 subunit delta|nr:DNA polymerase III subunit delta [Actinomycetes bacterium]
MAKAKTTAGHKQELKALYLILSEQSYLREQPLARLRTRLDAEAGEGQMEFNAQTFAAPDAAVDDIIAAANTLPFMVPYRLIVVTDIEKYNTEDYRALAAYAQAPSPTTILVLVGEKLAKNTTLYKAIAAHGVVMERKAPLAKDLPATVVQFFVEWGLQADTAAARALINLVGKDLGSLRSAVSKVKTSLPVGAVRVTSAEVAAVVGQSAEVKIWEFSNALSERDGTGALRLLRRSLQQGGNSLGALPFALRSIRDLIAARAYRDRNPDGQSATAQLAASLNKPEWLARKLMAQAERFTADELRGALTSLADVEQTLKTSPPEIGGLAFERWIVELCAT